MRVVGIGAQVRHTLVAVETAQQAAAKAISYAGSVDLVCELLSETWLGKSVPKADRIIHINSEMLQTFAECRQHPVRGMKHKEGEPEVWRINRAVAQTKIKCDSPLQIDGEAAGMLVIEVPYDAALLLDNRVVGEKSRRGWVVVKTESVGYLGSRLYESIYDLYENRHVVIMSISAVRKMSESPLINSLSWESVAEGLQAALNGKFRKLAESKRLPHAVIVSIVNDGAAYFDFKPVISFATTPSAPQPPDPRLTLIYDPHNIEGQWSEGSRGRMAGYTQCIMAAVAAGLGSIHGDAAGDFVIAGLLGGRSLHKAGFDLLNSPHFPTKAVGDQIKEQLQKKADKTFKTIEVPSEEEVNWSIVKQRFLEDPASPVMSWKDIKTKIFQLVKLGIEKDSDLPLVQFDKLTAVLREEIEGVRAMRGLMLEYNGRKANKRPLSIAVFGWPGTGKSFAVKSVAKAISQSGREFDIREFNLSQFSAPDQLYQALHQVRDVALSGKMPLVFWDEFDSDFQGQHYGWLRYFLAPMQDGKFTQGQITHSVGDAVFVFAGGTSRTMEDFRRCTEHETAAKGPDFLSRLHGFLNIASLNHEDILLASVLIRRAVLFRGILKDYAPGIEKEGEGFDIDESVITAFMCIPEFRYGARSMEAILTMSNLHGKNRFEASWLPPLAQVDIHVDSAEWQSLLKGRGKLLREATPGDPAIGW